ncbi:putative splicing factor, arginine/serine-rich [Dirofilaria immitis]
MGELKGGMRGRLLVSDMLPFPVCWAGNFWTIKMARRNECLECKVFVGGLPNDASSEELEEAFSKYGRIKKVWLARRPPGFAFVEFEDSRDAEDAVKGLDGTRICGVRPRVEFSHGGSRRGGRGGGGRRRSSPLPPYQRFLRNSFYEFSFRSLHTTTAVSLS